MAAQVLDPALKVLIVEDSPEDRVDLIRYLTKEPGHNYQFEEAALGEVGLVLYLSGHPDLILLDISLPDISGLEFLKRLSDRAGELPCPVIVITGPDTEVMANECLKLGAYDYLVKTNLDFELLSWSVQNGLAAFRQKIQERFLVNTQILESISDGFYALDEEERFIYVNKVIENQSGLRRERMLGRKLLEIFPLFEKLPVYAQVHQALVQQEERRFETFLQFSKTWARISIYPGGGGVTVYFQDITERKEAEEQRQRWQEELEKQVAERTLSLAAEIEQRRSAEEELRKSQELYRSVLEAMSEGLVVHALDGSIIAANRNAEMLLGIPTTEINGRTSFDPRWQAIHKDGTPFPGETHPARVTLQTGHPCTGEIMGLRWPDGRLRWIQINSEPLFQPDKTTLRGVVATFSDITERKLGEEALRESEEQYHSLYDNNFYGVLLGTADGQILAANEAACQLLGYDEQELRVLGRQGLVTVTTSNVESSPDRRRPKLKVQLEGDLTRKNGTRFTCEYAVNNFLDRNRQERLCVVFQDITERKRLEEAVRESEEQYRLLFNNNLYGVVVGDLDGKIFALNPAGRQLLGYAENEIAGLQRKDIVDLKTATTPFDKKQLRKDKQVRWEGIFLRKGGGRITCEVATSLFLDKKGIEHLCLVFQDITERRRLEEALHQSEERFRVAQENSPHGFLIMKCIRDEMKEIAGFEAVYANPVAERMVGFKPEELPGNQYLSTQVAGYQKQLLENFRSVVETGTSYHGTYEFEYRGYKGWVENTTVKLADGVAATIRNVTQQKETEIEINRREREFRTLAENSPDLIIRTDLDLQIKYINPATVKFIGVSPEKVQGKTVPQTGYPSTQWDRVLNLRDKMLKTGLPQKAGAEVRRVDGSMAYIETQLIPELNTAGQPETILVIARDLTELRKAHSERLNQERFKALFELSPDGVVLYDRAGKTIDCNQALVALAGLSRESMLGKSATDLGYIDREEMERIIGQAIQNLARAEILTRDLEVIRPDQTKITISVKLQTVMLNDQVHFMCTVRDITFRKQMEDELRQALEQQRELTEMKSRFISTISHEFRTPLAVIQAIGESFDKYLERMTPVQIRERVEKIKAQISNITKLLNDVLAYNQLQAGIQGYNPIAGDLLGFSRDLLEELMELDRNQHLFRLLLPQTTLEVSFDQVLMKQVLSNLVSNAIKYSVVGTEIEFELKEESDQVLIRVTDQGIGIPEKDQANIFEAFSRAGNVGTIQGTGMGLAVLKEAVNLAGGRISFTSQEGQGTTFIVTLPLQSS